jgi:SAM-dependent methyltransferase
MPRTKKQRGKKNKQAPEASPFTAKTADKHELYQLSVQSPEEDVEFLERVYKKARDGKKPTHLREDFCGTGLLSSHWLRRKSRYTAEGFDIDEATVQWGIDRNFEPLGDEAERMEFHIADVREPSRRAPDIRCAHNFSYCVFKERETLLEYLRAVHADLADDGVFSIDIHGGPDSMEEMEEEREIDEGFEYVWDQDQYWPVTADYRCFIHFRFEDGTEMRKAFVYDWRLWTLMELKDALRDAGFAQVDCYWEGTADDGESGNGVFRKTRRGENCMSWIAYLVALK